MLVSLPDCVRVLFLTNNCKLRAEYSEVLNTTYYMFHKFVSQFKKCRNEIPPAKAAIAVTVVRNTGTVGSQL